MRILVSGAGGFVGRHLLARAARAGHEALPLTRTDGGGFAADWPAGIETLVHLAALNPRRGDPASQDFERLRRANVEGTRELARRAARAGVRRVILLGSAAVHGASIAPVREAGAPAPQSPYAVSKLEAERAFWDTLGESGGTTGVVLRPVAVFGPGAGNLTGALARLARTPLPLPLGGLGDPRSLVSVDGLAEAILLALTAEAAAGETFLVADDGPLTPAEIVAALREGAGRRARVLPAPVRLASAAARLLGKDQTLAAATRGLVVDNRHIRAALGWQPADARAALARMAADGRL